MSTRKYICVCAQFLLLSVNLALSRFKSLEFSSSEHFSKIHLRYLTKVTLCVLSVCYPAENKVQLNSNRTLTNKTENSARNKQYCWNSASDFTCSQNSLVPVKLTGNFKTVLSKDSNK